MKKLINIFINPFVLAFFISLAIIYFLPSINKYELILVKKTAVHGPKQEYFYDLNHDSFSEYIRLGVEKPPYTFPYMVYGEYLSQDEAPQILHQLNLNRPWLTNTEIVFGDYDNDDVDEIFVFSMSNDSLFIIGIKLFDSVSIFLEKFISIVPVVDGVPDFRLYSGGIHKINDDEYGDLVFNLSAGFSVYPRAIYLYDIKNDSLRKTNTQNVFFGKEPRIAIDKKIGPIICTGTYAPENEKADNNRQFTDSSSWLMAFDRNLELLFKPIEYKGFTSGIDVFPVVQDSTVYLFSRFTTSKMAGKNFIARYDLNGDQIAKMNVGKYDRFSILSPEPSSGYLYYQTHNKIYKLNYDLEKEKLVKRSKKIGNFKEFMDLDTDGKKELLDIDLENQCMFISRNDLSHPAEIGFPYLNKQVLVSKVRLKESDANLFIRTGNNSLFYYYSQNPLYFFKYPLYFSIYAVVLLFFLLIFYQQKKRLQARFEHEKKMNELELLTIKNQIDPHFTFNAINSLSSMIFDKDRKVAHNFLVDFSELIRNTLNNSKKISVRLHDEVDFVSNYLKLQQTRFENRFSFEFDIDQKVDMQTLVPRMIIQTFTENAVKHGLLNKEGQGEITIGIKNESNNLLIEIKDDGIGRKKSKEFNVSSTGKGHDIIDQIIELYNNLNKTNVSYEIKDLKNISGKPEGTCVKIVIPNISN